MVSSRNTMPRMIRTTAPAIERGGRRVGGGGIVPGVGMPGLATIHLPGRWFGFGGGRNRAGHTAIHVALVTGSALVQPDSTHDQKNGADVTEHADVTETVDQADD